MPGDTPDPQVEATYRSITARHRPGRDAVEKIERFAFYERAKTAFAVVITGDTAKYGNLILAKGLCHVPAD